MKKLLKLVYVWARPRGQMLFNYYEQGLLLFFFFFSYVNKYILM